MHILELEWLLVQLGRPASALVYPGGDIGEMLIVAQGFAVLGLELLPEVAATRFLPVQRVEADELTQLEEVRDPAQALRGGPGGIISPGGGAGGGAPGGGSRGSAPGLSLRPWPPEAIA
jgi:hypothetical protein